MPRFHVRGTYSTHADDHRDAVAMFLTAIAQPGGMVFEVFPDDGGAPQEFDGDDLNRIAGEVRASNDT